MTQTARISEGPLYGIGRLTQNLAMRALAIPASLLLLKDEVGFLQQYFSEERGMQTLLDFYLRAETAQFVEPAGFIDRNTGECTFLDPPKERKAIYNAILRRDIPALRFLDDQLDHTVGEAFKHGREREAEDALIFQRALRRYMEIGDNPHEVLDYYEDYCISSYQSPFREPQDDAVEVHIHPNKARVKNRLEGGQVAFDVKPGYSYSDILGSKGRSLGLIEYEQRLVNYGNEDELPFLQILFKISHRLNAFEREVGRAQMLVDFNKLHARGVNGERRAFQTQVTPRYNVAPDQALDLLSRSVYVLPFLDLGWEAELAIMLEEVLQREAGRSSPLILPGTQRKPEVLEELVLSRMRTREAVLALKGAFQEQGCGLRPIT